MAAALVLLGLAGSALAEVKVTQTIGTVQVKEGGAWVNVASGHALSPGQELRTGRASRCILVFTDGSKVEIGPNGSFTVEEEAQDRSFMSFGLGRLRAWVGKSLTRKFQVRTPTAVASVRGTEFQVDVQQDGATGVACFQGVMGVADLKGNEVIVNEGQQVNVTQAGMGAVVPVASQGPASDSQTRSALKREVGLDMSKEEIQAAAALEARDAVYRSGKALIDVNGNRVRVDDYIIRPGPREFKLVFLNERVDRFDYFYYRGIFNKTLPEDISIALRQIRGQAFTAPEFFLTSFETGRSNTQDSVLETASGGHLVDRNNNGDDSDNVTSAFDPKTDAVVNISVPNVDNGPLAGNQSFFEALFDKYRLSFNGVDHLGWDRAAGVAAYDGTLVNPTCVGGVGPGCLGVQNYSTGAGGHIARIADETQLVTQGCEDLERCTFSDKNRLFDRLYSQNAAGTKWDRFDNYIINDAGQVGARSEFAGLSSGANFKTVLLHWNYEQVITASEFGGRKIDLVFEPRILIQSGLIP